MSSNYSRFSCALITGGAGGLGKAIAQDFVSRNIKVLLVGRTESTLAATAAEVGAAAHYVLDVGNISELRAFAQKVVTEHPDLDCLINNAAVQRPLNVLETDRDEFLSKADQEIDINVRGPLHLIMELLPHLRAQKSSVIVNVSSVLGFLPFATGNPGYNATKAWMHSFSLNLRTQLSGTNIKVVEVVPPMVGTDIHRDRPDPDDNKKHKNPNALTVEEWTDDFKRKMENGEEVFSAGLGEKVVQSWQDSLGTRYETLIK